MVATKKKYRKNKNKSPSIIFGGIFLVALVLALAGYGIWRHYHSSSLGPNVATHSSPADNNLNNIRKSSSNPAQTLDNGPTANSPTSPSNISLTITRAAVFDSSLEVGTLVSGTTTGTCALNVSQSGQQPITRSEPVALSNNSYACPVFNVPLSQFPNQNDWNVSVTLTSGSSSATAAWAHNPVNLSAASI